MFSVWVRFFSGRLARLSATRDRDYYIISLSSDNKNHYIHLVNYIKTGPFPVLLNRDDDRSRPVANTLKCVPAQCALPFSRHGKVDQKYWLA